MSLENLFTQTPREAPSAPMRETFITPMLLPVCCICGLIRIETGSTPGLDRWITQRTYRETHDVNPIELALTHTYCPTCFTKAQETVRQYFRQIGASPMTLLAGSPDIDTSLPVLPDAPHQAADREKGPRNKASVPPGEFCLRCGGLLVPSYTASLERDVTGKPVTLWRCVNCGDCVDHDILANRGKGPGSGRVRA